MSKYFATRGDNFYYLEVYSLQELRDMKISSLLEIENPCIRYFCGSQSKFSSTKQLHSAIFWKNKESAEYRIECMNRKGEKYFFKIKSLNRDEFIEVTRPKEMISSRARLPKTSLINRNMVIRTKEISYKRKLDNLKLESDRKIIIQNN